MIAKPGFLWYEIEILSSKEDVRSWTVQDAFEDFKSCKAETDKASRRWLKEGKNDRLKINANARSLYSL